MISNPEQQNQMASQIPENARDRQTENVSSEHYGPDATHWIFCKESDRRKDVPRLPIKQPEWVCHASSPYVIAQIAAELLQGLVLCTL
jgi:hypothetical protein